MVRNRTRGLLHLRSTLYTAILLNLYYYLEWRWQRDSAGRAPQGEGPAEGAVGGAAEVTQVLQSAW